MIDIHTHILPRLDDGAKDSRVSIELLKRLQKQGVETVVATPHYIGNCSIKSFLEKRQNAYNELRHILYEFEPFERNVKEIVEENHEKIDTKEIVENKWYWQSKGE